MGVVVDKSGRHGLAIGSVGRTTSPASKGKAPRTARGEKTLRKILDAAGKPEARERFVTLA